MSQPLLFETGRPSLPPGVTVFASGANEAREIRGFTLAGVSIGVSVSSSAKKLSENCSAPPVVSLLTLARFQR